MASLSQFTVCCLMLAVAPAMADTLYSNGPYNGTTDAWTINFGFSVSDAFNAFLNFGDIKGEDIVYWDPSTTDVLTTVDVQIGTTSFGGSIQTSGGVTNTFLGINQFGYSLFQGDFSINSIEWEGPGWFTLSNACTTGGCSENPIYWDENSGPSTAYENSVGSIPSEAFTLTGTSGGATPEPSSIMLFGSGILSLAGILRRKLMG